MTRAPWLGMAKHFPREILLLLAVFAFVAAPVDARAAKQIVIGTGGVTGVYYPVGGAICRLVNVATEFHGLRCLVESTSGSVDNTARVIDGRLEFGIVQSDVQWKAVRGEAPFAEKQDDLRAVLSLYPETAVLAASPASGIVSAPDLRGKRLNLGATGSGTRATAEDALDAIGMAPSDLAAADELGLDALRSAAARNNFDAFFLLAGHPSDGLKAILESWQARVIPLSGNGIHRLIAGRPYYVRADVPGGLYPGVDAPVATFAVKATLVASSDLSEATVYNVVKSVWLARDALRDMHPALATFDPERVTEGLTAPMHRGACRFFREKGIACTPAP